MTAADAEIAVARLREVMDVLRSPGGCPWDAAQTHESLVEYLVEETYETIDAIDARDSAALKEELGDLLLQIVFHARIAEERPDHPWGLAEVASGITEKLIRRHPHVFAEVVAPDAESAEASWQARKVAEKGRQSVTDGVPVSMPGLPLAAKLVRRAERGGLSVEAGSAAARRAAGALAADADADQLGDFLLALAAIAAERGVDLDAGFRRAVRRYRDAILGAERARERDQSV